MVGKMLIAIRAFPVGDEDRSTPQRYCTQRGQEPSDRLGVPLPTLTGAEGGPIVHATIVSREKRLLNRGEV